MPTDAEIEARVLEHLDYARSIGGRWGRVYRWLADDFISDAQLALWEAARTHDPARGSLRGFVCVVVRRALAMRLRSERIWNPVAFGGQVLPGEPDPLDSATARDPGPEEQAEDADAPVLLAALPPHRRELVVRHVVDGETLAALAAERGVSRQAIHYDVTRGLEAMRDAAGA